MYFVIFVFREIALLNIIKKVMVYLSGLITVILLSCTSIQSFLLNNQKSRYIVRCFSKKKTNGVENGSKIGFQYKPKTDHQITYVQYLSNSSLPLVVALGPAGSGKTMFACMEAIKQLNERTIKKIVLTRPLVAVEEEEIGFLPGSMISKMEPWTKPMFDIFRELYSTNELNIMVKDGVIEIAPLAFMRGRTFHDSFVIADEMQNSSPSQMLMLTTRLGMHSKMVITGDLQQTDRTKNNVQEMNGLSDLMDKYDNWRRRTSSISQHIAIVQMQKTDVFRSHFVRNILDIYDANRTNLFCVNETVHSVESSKSSRDDRQLKNNDCALIPLHHMSKHFPKDMRWGS